MSDSREFPIAVVASIASGVLLCKFSDMHEAAEYLMGHPIWTHHFASKPLWEKMRAAVLAQHPNMFSEDDGTINADNWQERLAEIEARCGTTCVIRKGAGEDAPSPFDGIPAGKSTLILST